MDQFITPFTETKGKSFPIPPVMKAAFNAYLEKVGSWLTKLTFQDFETKEAHSWASFCFLQLIR